MTHGALHRKPSLPTEIGRGFIPVPDSYSLVFTALSHSAVRRTGSFVPWKHTR